MDIDQAYLDAEAALAILFSNMIGPTDPNAYRIVHRPVIISQEMRERILALPVADDTLLVEYVARFEYMEIIDVEFVVIN